MEKDVPNAHPLRRADMLHYLNWHRAMQMACFYTLFICKEDPILSQPSTALTQF